MAKPSWITVSKSSGSGDGSVVITAAKNTSSSSRTGTVTVKTAGGVTKTIAVSQSGQSSSTPNSLKITFSNVAVRNMYEDGVYDLQMGAVQPESLAFLSTFFSDAEDTIEAVTMEESIASATKYFSSLILTEGTSGAFSEMYVAVRITGGIESNGIQRFSNQEPCEIQLANSYPTDGTYECKMAIVMSSEYISDTIVNQVLAEC